ncbi:hypothetical protein LIER_03186 [Lithospermum erythrorhizon]|uniref:RNase H type-1 domain-containing protein n=1 Tax=Lithospermum erythrorhizon TaxID=34254 RepID=A0AAV3NS90_LITER
MQPLREYKDIRKLTGCLAALSRFISKSDGATNKKGSGAGILIRGLDNIVMEYTLRFTFSTTNNEAEYGAMVAGLAIVRSLGISRIWVKGDSKLDMDQIVFEHIPRAQNEEDDHLSRLSTTYYDELSQGVYVEVREASAYQEAVTLPIFEEPEDWRTLIVQYLVKGQLPGNGIEARKNQNRSFRFYIGTLTRRIPPTWDLWLFDRIGYAREKQGKETMRWIGQIRSPPPPWEGPYRISRMLGPRTYELERMNGEVILRTWHASKLVKYYV